MFGDRPFREPSLVLIGATIFAVLFEGVSLLVDYVVTGAFALRLDSLLLFTAAFVGYVAVAALIRHRGSDPARPSDIKD